MKYQKFENDLKHVFDNATAVVDIDDVIHNIHRTQPKSRNKWIWLSLFAVFCIGGVVGLNGIIENNHKEILTDKTQYLAKAATVVNASQKKKTVLSKQVSSSVTTPTDEDTDSNSIIKTTTASKKINSINTITKQKKSIDFLPSNTASNNETLINKPTANVQLSNINPTHLQASDRLIKTVSKSKNITSTTTRQKLTAHSLVHRVELLSSQRRLPRLQKVDCPTFDTGMKWHIDIIPEIGLILPLKTLAYNGSEPSEVFALRQENEDPLEGIQAALYARVRPGNKPYYLKVGLSYTRVSERMKREVNYIERDTTVGIISITESQNGDTLTVIMGDIITETEFTGVSIAHYFLHMIDIPVAVGYSKSIGSGWRLGGEVGAQFNISMSTKGKLLEGPNSYTNLPEGGRFNTNLGLSFFGGLTLEKSLGERSSFYISSRFRYFPSSFTPDSYNVSQKYQFIGLHAGYIYSL